jgi:hypothetical protein
MSKLFMVLLGATPVDRLIEQHDIFFGIAESMDDLLPAIRVFWPGTKLHIDAWREVNVVNNCEIKIVPAGDRTASAMELRLFFINLGGYKPGEFEEFHYKMLIAAENKGEAITESKKTAFFRHTGFEGANAHVDDKYGIDVDDLFEIRDILPVETKERFAITVGKAEGQLEEDALHLGYFKLDGFKQ